MLLILNHSINLRTNLPFNVKALTAPNVIEERVCF